MFLKWKIIIALLVLVATTTASMENDEYPKNDYKTFFKDFGEALGIEQILDTIGFYFRTWIRIGQAYNWKKFDNDVSNLKKSFTLKKGFYFSHKIFWVTVSQSSVKLIEFLKESQQKLLLFLKKKCDFYLGREAALHPWNVMMDQNEQHVSFLVFVYSLAISLIAIKLLSWWNFMVYLAFWFLVYSFGGPYTLFKGLLTVTAFFWYIGDLVLRYPFHTAIGILTLFFIRYFWKILSLFVSKLSSSDHTDASSAAHLNGYKARERGYKNENKDISILSSRLDGIERKTDILTDRLERLSRAMERIGPDQDDIDSD